MPTPDRIASVLATFEDNLPENWAAATLTYRRIASYGESFLDVELTDGSHVMGVTSSDTSFILRQLRDDMYVEDQGTWVSAVLWFRNDEGRTHSTSFNYHVEPDWDVRRHWVDSRPEWVRVAYQEELKRYPRTLAPGWLSGFEASSRSNELTAA